MRKILLLVSIALTVLTGCAQRYKITLNNNSVVTTRSRPKLDKENGVYRFKDYQGKAAVLPAIKIREIEPL